MFLPTGIKLFGQGVRDAANAGLIRQLQQSHPGYRRIVRETQKVQSIIFVCQLIYSVCLQKVLDWCWAPLQWIWILSLNTYISMVFEIVLFLFVGWKTLDLNHKFAKLTASKSVVQPKPTNTNTFEQLAVAWESMVKHVNDALFELVKMICYSALSRILISVFQWTTFTPYLWQFLSFCCLSLLQSIQIFDQAFAALPARILSRMYDHYLWYFIGFGTWVSLFFLLVPVPIHFKVIVLYWAYPWFLVLALNASIQPDVRTLLVTDVPVEKRVGIEACLLFAYNAFNRLAQLLHDYKIIATVSKLLGWNAYHWKPILYTCGLATFASGCVRLLLLFGLALTNKR